MTRKRLPKKAPPRPGRAPTGREPTPIEAVARRRELEAAERSAELGEAGELEDAAAAKAWRRRRRELEAARDRGELVLESHSEPARGGGTITFQLEHVRCGKCTALHGPYWYAYQRQGGKLRKVYVGRKLDVAKARAALAGDDA